MGRPHISEDPDHPRVVFGQDPFCPEGSEYGGLDLLGDSKNGFCLRKCSPACEDHRVFCCINGTCSFVYLLIRRKNVRTADAGLAGTVLRIQRLFLDVIGNRYLCDSFSDDCIFEGAGQEKDCHIFFVNSVVVYGNRPEERILVNFLDPSRSGILGLDLPVQGDD